jgi:opacity protein-like surface antigen
VKKAIAAIGLALAVGSGPAVAQEFKQDNAYVGAGIGLNSVDVSGADDAIGFQIFAGYRLDMVNVDPVKLAVEIGYMDSGDFEVDTPFGTFEDNASGIWLTAVAAYPLNQELNLLGRLGLDFGDDDGPMLGVGIGYTASRQIEVRGEYVIRDDIDSLQANVVYHF